MTVHPEAPVPAAEKLIDLYERRAFVVCAGGMIGAVIGSGPPGPDDEAAVKEAVRILYAVYSEGRDPQKYRSLLRVTFPAWRAR